MSISSDGCWSSCQGQWYPGLPGFKVHSEQLREGRNSSLRRLGGFQLPSLAFSLGA